MSAPSDIPATMRAVIFNDYGDLSQLKLATDQPVPVPDDNEVLIRMYAASLNPVDWKVLHGYLKDYVKKTFPVVVGWDGAGVVAKVGKNVKHFKPGDEVYTASNNTPKGGTFAEYCCPSEDDVAKKPSNVTFAEAASFPVAVSTAYQSLELGQVKKLSKVLILGGSGGVGSVTVQIAKAHGALVFATCSTSNVALVKGLGADTVIDYKTSKWEEHLKGHHLDAIIDTVGGSYVPAQQVLKKGGIFVTIAGAPEKEVEHFPYHYLSIIGKPNGQVLTKVGELIQAGHVKPLVDTAYQFTYENVITMFKYSESQHTKGKLVLCIAPNAAAKEEKKAGTMRAARYHAFGGIENVRVEETIIPEPADDEVLVKVHAAGSNPVDWKILSGKLQAIFPLELPVTPGFDVSGVVVKVGKNATQFKAGDEVYGDAGNTTRNGTFAEFTPVTETKLAKKPKNMSHIAAAAVPLTMLTSWQALEAGHVGKGTKLLVLGGSGGCGMFGVQLAKAWDAYVAATCSTDNVELVKQFGADVVIDYKKEKWSDTLKGQNFDAVYDTVGEQGAFEAAQQILRKGGTFVSIVNRLPSTPDYTFANFIKSTSEGGKTLTKVAELIEAGKIHASVEKVYEFTNEQVQQLFQHSMSGRARGKLVLKISH